MNKKFCVFLGGYSVYCLYVLVNSMYEVAFLQSYSYLFSGVVAVCGLFLSAMWIDDGLRVVEEVSNGN